MGYNPPHVNPTWLFVAAVYALAVAAGRRAGAAIPTRVAVLFYLLVLGYLFEPMTGRTVNVHADVLTTLSPWANVMAERGAANGEMNDVPLQEVPWAHAVREAWKSLRVPLWNETAGSGSPLLANAQSQALSPLRLITLPLNLGHALTAEAAVKMLIAMTFLFLYCRRRWSEEASVVSAVSFAFSGFLFVWLHFPVTTTACLLPAVLYFIDLLVERVTWARFTSAAILWAIILVAGHPETAVHLFLGAVMYALWLWPGLKTLTRLGSAMLVAALLAAPYLAMFSEAMTKSRRFHNLQHVEPFDAVPLPYSDLASAVPMLQPLFYGPIADNWGPGEADALSGFVGVLALAAWIAVAWWVVATRAWRSKEAFFVLLGLLVTGVVFEWPGFTDTLHFLIPIGAHARLRVLLVCALAILAGAAIDHARERRAPLLVGLAVVAATMAGLLFGFEFPEVVRHYRPFALQAAIPGTIVLLTAATFVLMRRKKIAFAVLFAAVVVDLWVAGRWFNPPTAEAFLYPRTPIIEKLEALHREAKEPFRITGYGAMLFPNSAALYGFEDMRVHDPMANHRYLDFLAATSKFNPAEYFQMWDDTNSHVVDFLNVRYMVADPGVPADPYRWRRVYDAPDGQIFENTTVLPRFYAPKNVILEYGKEHYARRLREMDDKWLHTVLLEDLKIESPQMESDLFKPRPADAPVATVQIEKRSATEYRVRTNAPRHTLIASSIAWWPGWKVEHGGKRIEPLRVNSAFLGFAVPPGQSDVRVSYAPDTWRYGALVSLATLLALIAAGIRSARSRAGSRPRG